MDSHSLLERLETHRTLTGVPREQLEWLVANGYERVIEPTEILTHSNGPVLGLFIVLEGHLTITVDRGAGPRTVMEWKGGDVTGVLPYSRIKSPPGHVVAQQRTVVLVVERPHMPRLIHDCPELTAVLVHVMLDRARVFKSSELLDEKMASLGRLAAGLAHELNNPASAVARTSKMLQGQLAALDETTKRFCGLNLNEAQRTAIEKLRTARTVPPATLSPLERSDRAEAVSSWLSTHGLTAIEADPLAEYGLKPADLDALHASVGGDKMGAVLAYISAGRSARELAAEIDTAATRIHSLVAAVKGFTYVDQQATLKPVAIGQGLSDTITVLRAKAKGGSVNVELNVPPTLPCVEGYGGELNQVWANLIDNAIDAAPNGRVVISAEPAGAKVIVRVVDDGKGIPPEVASRIFDPFFTTKDVGQGTGLGLDIARRIVLRHHGEIEASSKPGRTEFKVTLPAVTPGPTG